MIQEDGSCYQCFTTVTAAEPALADDPHLWRLARDSQVLDLHSSYAYLLWCRDFAGTSVVAKVDGNVVGFVTGYLRPVTPDTVMVWQVAVEAGHRRRNLGSRMLHTLIDRLWPQGVRWLQATISPSHPNTTTTRNQVRPGRDSLQQLDHQANLQTRLMNRASRQACLDSSQPQCRLVGSARTAIAT